MPDGYMEAAAIPDAGGDTLREQLARIACEALDWRWLPERTETGDTLVPSPTEAIMPAIDALLPRIREHVAAVQKAERERVSALLAAEADKADESAADRQELHKRAGDTIAAIIFRTSARIALEEPDDA